MLPVPDSHYLAFHMPLPKRRIWLSVSTQYLRSARISSVLSEEAGAELFDGLLRMTQKSIVAHSTGKTSTLNTWISFVTQHFLYNRHVPLRLLNKNRLMAKHSTPENRHNAANRVGLHQMRCFDSKAPAMGDPGGITVN